MLSICTSGTPFLNTSSAGEYAVARLDDVMNMAQRTSIWPLTFGTVIRGIKTVHFMKKILITCLLRFRNMSCVIGIRQTTYTGDFLKRNFGNEISMPCRSRMLCRRDDALRRSQIRHGSIRSRLPCLAPSGTVTVKLQMASGNSI